VSVIAYEVPLISAPQTLSTTWAGVVYNLNIYWNWPSQTWIMDIADSANTPLLSGVPLVTGCDLLAQYKYLKIGGQLTVQTDHDRLAPPTFTNLGQTSHLYFIPDGQS